MIKGFILTALILSLTWTGPMAKACTSFLLPYADGAVMSKSYDWHLSHGMMIVNKKNMQKTSISILPGDKTLQWISKYGSLTFNQYGREFPLGGINEKGLMIEVLWLAASQYPDPDQRASLNELQWIQYQLDSAQNTTEAIQLAQQIRISPVNADVHYLVCDQQKKCATFEYIGKKLVVHSSPKMLVPSITNNTYADSENYLKDFLGFGGTKSLPTGSGSLSRFVRASSLAKNFDKNDQKILNPVDYALGILDNVASGSYSKWNIVYDFKRNLVHMKNRFGSGAEKIIHPKNFNYSCKTNVSTLKIDSDLSGEVQNNFEDYQVAQNQRIIELSVGQDFPQWLVTKLIQYPETNTRCVE